MAKLSGYGEEVVFCMGDIEANLKREVEVVGDDSTSNSIEGCGVLVLFKFSVEASFEGSYKTVMDLLNLSDFIFHKIIYRLDIKDIARFATLSRRCRKPFLDIAHNEVALRQFEFYVGNWILQATKSNAERIYLEFDSIQSFRLPSGVLDSASLRDLALNLGGNGLLKLPSTSCRKPEILSFQKLRISNKLLSEWILSCKSLKELNLVGVSGFNRINITSSSLEYLRIENINVTRIFNIAVLAEKLEYLYMLWPFETKSPTQSLTLYAPKLQNFIWTGHFSDYSYEGNFESLRYADTLIVSRNLGAQNQLIINGSVEAKVVSNSTPRFMAVKSTEEFCNLHTLTLLLDDLATTTPIAASFINLTPYLNLLRENSSYNVEYWESQNLKVVNSLKEVEMEFDGEQNEIKLIKYLLKNASIGEDDCSLYI
ncbi:hypothetical protein FEM48_Zijuj05G0111500 [Ziziphus jujuba var. spinosa]|uniref:F-box domain-containing protein n=1 Tax=Ziziphus jujuba var. spinosa TaxID=714518 RepID=A0A978VEL8_ZIZJJ|nr:hypothetical protein FEM48_Zijuj05G0111500 [Ziziphus jujuba var. spinosa]